MIKYFKELLNTFKHIEKHLETLSGCVEEISNGNNYEPIKRIMIGHRDD